MNRVGREGRGESVWMGFFLAATIDAFLPEVEARGDATRAERYRQHRADLAAALDADGWDGDWYRRAFYDDGAVMGSADQRRVPDRRARAGLGRSLGRGPGRPCRPARSTPWRRAWWTTTRESSACSTRRST